ncbi:apolipoprotein N-acyltransferase [Sphingomonas mesophila]|uniref:apolipoprotein N-acyltransferase n=1 Tax=Sphingomonas mesophila TaxID=2303576 RepID=UPI001F082C27|nr:apolipoprotein N-acyltransferase [Sphingomonas mesophila]
MTIKRPLGALALAIGLGAASALAFEPVGWWPLMIAAFALLCALIASAESLKRALLIGWGFGVGQFVLGLNWIATAFTFQAKMPAWLGWVAVVLLALYLAVYPMLAAGLAWRFGRARPLALVLALGGGWAITEWLRATMFTGFAWNPVGVTLVDTPWRAPSALIGTYGLSALVVLAGGMAWLASRKAWRAPAAFAATALLLLALPFPRLTENPSNLRIIDAEERAAPPAQQPIAGGRLRIVQPNIGQADKWRAGFDRIAADRLTALTLRPYRSFGPAATIFWPEAAVTRPLIDERAGAELETQFERSRAIRALKPGQLLATGGLALTARDGVNLDGATNSVFVLDSAGRIVARYDKAHLVPYGEYLPMRPLLGAIGLSRLAPGDLDFRPGPGPRTLALPDGMKMGVQICYEIIFSGDVVDERARPDYIFNPSNDAWFGAWGPPQHLAQARLRAAEEGLPVIRSTPTGISATIDASGRLLGSVGGGKAGTIDASFGMKQPPTPFGRFGNAIPLALAFALLIAAIVLDRRGRYRADI